MHPQFKERLLCEATIAGLCTSTYIKHVLLEKWGESFSTHRKLTTAMIKHLRSVRDELEKGYTIPYDDL